MEAGKGMIPWRRLIGRRVMFSGLGVTWLVLLVTVAIPRMHSALVNHREVQRLERELADLDAWTVAGLWLAPEVAERRPGIEAAWDRSFPASRSREELFLEIARVADAVGLRDFDLTEMDLFGEEAGPPKLQEHLEGYLEGGGAVDGVPVEIPRIDLGIYRLKAEFQGNYGDLAGFLGRLQRLDRALSVHNLAVSQYNGKTQIELELDVYVSQTS
ncbi:MAG: hypothetical protein AB7V45_07155 [Candidatus Krumholzibacteriia bacterium]